MRMAQKIKKRSINLLPHKGDSLINQFLSWALTIGRLLIIITEGLALSVFFYRFVLDVQIIDLHDKIEAQSRIVQSFQDGEKLFRNLQARLAFAKEYDADKETTLTLLKEILDLGRNRVTFKNLVVSKDTIQIEVQAPSAQLLSLFTQELKNHPSIQQVTINRVENKTSSGIVLVGLSAEPKTASPKKQTNQIEQNTL